MKKWLLTAILGLFCFIVGWGFGYIRLPYLELNWSFWIGFVTSLGFVFSCLAFLALRRLKINDKLGLSESSSTKPIVSLLLCAVICFVFSIIYLGVSNRNLRALKNKKENDIASKNNQIKSLEQHKLSIVMSSILLDAKEKIRTSESNELSDETIAGIIDLSNLFKPYKQIGWSAAGNVELSPQRGQMLIFLAKMNMSESSFTKIKLGANFSYADLRNVDLSGIDLSGINLNKSSLKAATLISTKFANADLSEAYLNKAVLRKSILSGANLDHTNFSWADMLECNLDSAVLNSACLKNANLTMASCINSEMKHTILTGAMLLNSDFNGCNLYHADLKRANFTNVDFSETNLMWNTFDQTIMDSVLIFDNWIYTLDSLHNSGVQYIDSTYEGVLASPSYENKSYFLIRK